jgi:hypothetical protein
MGGRKGKGFDFMFFIYGRKLAFVYSGNCPWFFLVFVDLEFRS